MFRRTLILAFALVGFGGPVLAQFRPVPDTAKRGYVQHVQEMVITADGSQARLSPGATIRDQSNLIIVPTALPRDGAWADYQVDANGQVFRVWLLTPEELSKPRPAQK
ncbi:MAG: hypothetical protein EXR29_16110 [Betaproteobacteria bacterium]|nr:hypothetical protein [Betaproteobacteria bacterium]